MYAAEDLAAWQRGDWAYVSVVITASRDGIELGRSALGGCEYGWFPGTSERITPLNGDGHDFCNGYGPGLIADAVADAEQSLARIGS